jgi:FkbM family methyltransferase
MRIVGSLGKPEYVFRPLQVIRRLRRELETPKDTEEVLLPWGLPIQIHPAERIGSCIWRTGVHDLLVTESLWRLLDRGETAVDVGANIGYMTGLLALRVGGGGRVIALEPHPEIFKALRANVERWKGSDDMGRIELLERAASGAGGTAVLHIPALFTRNRGVASLEDPGRSDSLSCDVGLTTLDGLVEANTRVGILKLDVEGHELAVLDGASGLLERRAIRDILFEEHGTPPTPVTNRLERMGYEVFSLDATLWGPRVLALQAARRGKGGRERNLLATVDVARARDRFAPRGWEVLKTRRTHK